MEKIKFVRNENPKAKPADESKLGFGKTFTDHMFIMEYDEGQGWHDPRIVPYGDISLSPAAMVLHYGQEVFEGLKAYRTADDRILLFRPDKNFARLNSSNERLCIPPIDEEYCIEALKELIKVEKDWVPHSEGTSLYIRPFIFAADPFLGVHPAKKLYYMVILAPSGAYYPGGLNPVRIYVENSFVRAVRGGTGYAKTGGNYASSLKAQDEAEKLDSSPPSLTAQHFPVLPVQAASRFSAPGVTRFPRDSSLLMKLSRSTRQASSRRCSVRELLQLSLLSASSSTATLS